MPHYTNTSNPVDFPKSEKKMNERIHKLAEQAGFVRFSPEEDPHTPIDWSCDYSIELDKFAELIVRECADISKQSQWSEAKGEYYEGFNEAMIYVSVKIKKHFGIE